MSDLQWRRGVGKAKAYLRSKYQQYRWTWETCDSLSDGFFDGNLPYEKRQQLFKRLVSLVSIETHSFCNRRCSYCVNSLIDRTSATVRMSEATFDKIVCALAEMDYGHQIDFSLFNEPFADDSTLGRIQVVRKRYPNARLAAFSNGD